MSERAPDTAGGEVSVAPDTAAVDGPLSARDAAAVLGVSERTVRRAIARGALPATKHAGVYRIAPAALVRDRAALLGARGAAEPAPTGRVPVPLTPLVGRDVEAAAVRELLLGPDRRDTTPRCPEGARHAIPGAAAARLVTLTGPGGVGKTRLALRVAAEVADAYGDGVAFVALAPIREPALVAAAIGRALGVREGGRPLLEAVTEHLGRREMLLVLDNVEHLLAAAPLVADLLASCPRLTVLTTSRILLRLSGERVFPVPPLALPNPADPAARLAAAEAVRLFVARARDVRLDFALTDETGPAVAAICRRVDGLPLAIELAAARLRHLSAETLLSLLERRLPLLTSGPRDLPARLQTMRDAITWSHDLLSPAEQASFRRLAVFEGGFTLEAAEAVASRGVEGSRSREQARSVSSSTSRLPDSSTTLALVAALVDKSLLRVVGEAGGEMRYAMLETIREFGLERLAGAGEEAPVRVRHAAWCQRLGARALPFPLRGTVRPDVLDRLEIDVANLRAALAWHARQGEATALLDLAAALTQLWLLRGYRLEGLRWLERGLAMAAGGDVPPALRARACFAAAALGRTQEDLARAVELAEEALARFRALDDAWNIAGVMHLLGVLERSRGNLDRAAALHTEALALYRDLGEPFWVALVSADLGALAHWRGDLRRAAELLGEAVAGFRALDEPWGVGVALGGLALVTGDRGDHERAAAMHAEGLARLRQVGSKEILIDAVARVATFAVATGRARAAARLLGAVEAQSEALGYALERPERTRYARAVEDARSALGDEALAAAWATGRVLSLAEAVAAALAVVAEPAVTPAPSGLTPRQVEVLRLVAAGESNRAIGERLFISPVTVARHLVNLYSKLGVDSRAQAIAVARRHGLG